MKKVWSGRFKKPLDKDVDKFNSSINIDKRLFRYDIISGIAHVKALEKANIINKIEKEKIIKGLNTLLKKEKNINFSKYEDIHSAVEIELEKIIGNLAKKLHTGRSRNDLVITDTRLYLKDEIKIIKKYIKSLLKVIIKMAKKYENYYMPGYTHMQQAQVISVAHWFMAYFEMFKRDYKLLEYVYKVVDVLPLGCGALAGINYNIDRNFLKKELGFNDLSPNSMDAVSDRDFIHLFIYFASSLSIHLSRLSEELIIFNSKEFSFIEIDDAYATGSSIMPHKKNPDIFELIRGKTSLFLGELISILTLMKNLPLSYNKDFQEDKTILFNSIDRIKEIIFIITKTIENIKFKKEKLFMHLKNTFLYTVDIADYLVINKKIPFREAHNIAGKLVRFCVEKNKEINELKDDELKNIDKNLDKEIFKLLNPEKSVNYKKTIGSTNIKEIEKQIKKAEVFLKNEG